MTWLQIHPDRTNPVKDPISIAGVSRLLCAALWCRCSLTRCRALLWLWEGQWSVGAAVQQLLGRAHLSAPLCSTLQSYIKPSSWQASVTKPDNNSSDPTFEVIIPSVRFSASIFSGGLGLTSLVLSWYCAVCALQCWNVTCKSKYDQRAAVLVLMKASVDTTVSCQC